MAADDAATFLNTKWDTSATTVNGLVTEALGHLPTPRERVVVGDFEFEIEDVRRRALVSTVARRIRTEDDEDEERS
jgi:Mg2+/Co2+ transporter CorC